MSLKRQHKLNMPQLLWGGLSENWLLKELGDIHWQQITSALNTPSDLLTDNRGERLYASFVRLCWSGANIADFKENNNLALESSLSRYGSKMFFSETEGEGESGKFKANLMSVFSTREKSDNTKLKKGTLKAEIDADTVFVHSKLPDVAKKYLENKGEIFDKNNQLLPEAVLSFVYQKEYRIDAYDDINGVGLLYFASYPKINDKCEREFIKSHYELSGDWLEIAGVISRDIHYYGNANSDDKLIYELNTIKKEGDKIALESSLYRVKDQQLIARVYTIKQLQSGAKFEKLKETTIQQKEDLSFRDVVKNKQKEIVNTSALTSLNQETLDKIVIEFFKKILDEQNLTKDTNLSDLGIESIVYQELSEYLFEKHNIDSNPSRFYGASSIHSLTNYLLGKEDVIASSSNNNYETFTEDIAIVGISGRFPGASNKEIYWNNLKENKNHITEVTKERWDWTSFNKDPQKTQKTKLGGFIDGVGNFDPLFFGISPFEAELMDPQQRITLEAVYGALEDANIVPSKLKGSNTGVYIGVSGSDYAHITREARKDKVQAYDAIGNANSIIANRISYLLDIHGPNQAIDTACSSSLVAVDQAVKSIKNGTSDMAIAGGVHTMLQPELTMSYHEAGMLSVDGKCKTFDDTANGYVRGEGVGIIVLKSLKKAKEDGDFIYGLIKGSAVNHGGKANTLTSPNPKAQKALLMNAYNDAKVNPAEVSYIEAHGTGTPLGDPIEIEALKMAFEDLHKKQHTNSPTITNYCGIGSAKTNIGHLEAAAGIAGLIKVLLCMKYEILPGNPNLKIQNKYINLQNSPFYLRKESTAWKGINKKRIAGVSSFGFGGVNAHVVLEAYENKSKVYKSTDEALILVSAKNKDRLKEKVADLKQYLQGNTNLNVHDIAYTLQYGREEMEERLAFKVANVKQVIEGLQNYESGNVEEIITGNSRKENCDFLLEGDAGKAYMDIVINNKEYNLLAKLWVKGVVLDWRFLYGKTTPNKIALPTYPFAKQWYWVSKTTEVSETTNENSILEENETLEVETVLSLEDKVAGFLMSLLKKVLKLEEKDIDFSVDIADYGIDSIMSSIMIEDLREMVPDVPPLLFLEHKTFGDVVMLLVDEFAADFKGLAQSKSVSKKITTLQKEETPKEQKTINVLEDNSNAKKTNDLAIVGINGILPNTSSIHHFFNHIKNGTNLTEVIPEKRIDLLRLNEEEKNKIGDFHGAFIDDIENFDYKKFKFTKEEAIQIDPQLRKLIESVWKAIGDAGYKVKDFNKNETGVFVATKGNSGYAEVMQKNNAHYEIESPTLYANRLSHVFNLKGPSEVVDTACSSFIAAIQRASHAFERGDCSQAIVATATLNLSSYDITKEDLTGIYSKSGTTKSFSEDADGFVRSETIGTIIVKPLEKAKEDGDYIYGVVKGVGVYHGGKSPLKWNSPNIKGQKTAIEKAIKNANIDPTTVAYIEAEANGVSFVDTSEMVSIQSVYGNYLKNTENSKDKKLYIGSSKPLMGHAEASSTFPCLLKLLASFQKEKLFGVKGLSEINKGIKVEDNFEILKETINWQQEENTPKRLAMNCLGIGGVNTHLILEEYQNTNSTYHQKENNFVFIFSDENPKKLTMQLKNVAKALQEFESNINELELLNRLEFTLQEGRSYEKCRLAFIANSLEDVLKNIANWVAKTSTWSNEINRFYNLEQINPSKEEVGVALAQKNWKTLAEYWVSGTAVNWQEMRNNTTPQRLPIPTTFLEKSYCWPHEIVSTNSVDEVVNNGQRNDALFTLINGQTTAPYKIENDHLFLFDLKWKESYAKSKTIDDELEKHTLLCYLDKELPHNYSGKIIEKPNQYNEKTFTVLVNNVFLYFQKIIQQKPKKAAAIQIVLPKSCIHNSYGLTGMIHTCRQESTKIKAQLIFVENDIKQEELHTILEENAANIEDRIIKYDNGIRYVEHTSTANVINHTINPKETFKDNDVILITGGLGGLGIVTAKNIIENCSKATIVLVGRSILNEAKQQQLATLNTGEHKVVYYATDISNEKEVADLVENIIQKYTKLDGIIHCAGVIRDSYLMKKTTQEIEDVFKPKVYGAHYLDEYTKHISLRFFLCFSSLHSLGNPGQADYAMSNAYVDGLVRERNLLVLEGKRSGQAITMNWPYWKGGGMQLSNTAIDLMAMTKGSVPMPTQIGMEIMHYALQKGIEQLFVDMGNYDKIIKQHNILLKEVNLAL